MQQSKKCNVDKCYIYQNHYHDKDNIKNVIITQTHCYGLPFEINGYTIIREERDEDPIEELIKYLNLLKECNEQKIELENQLKKIEQNKLNYINNINQLKNKNLT